MSAPNSFHTIICARWISLGAPAVGPQMGQTQQAGKTHPNSIWAQIEQITGKAGAPGFWRRAARTRTHAHIWGACAPTRAPTVCACAAAGRAAQRARGRGCAHRARRRQQQCKSFAQLPPNCVAPAKVDARRIKRIRPEFSLLAFCAHTPNLVAHFYLLSLLLSAKSPPHPIKSYPHQPIRRQIIIDPIPQA